MFVNPQHGTVAKPAENQAKQKSKSFVCLFTVFVVIACCWNYLLYQFSLRWMANEYVFIARKHFDECGAVAHPTNLKGERCAAQQPVPKAIAEFVDT